MTVFKKIEEIEDQKDEIFFNAMKNALKILEELEKRKEHEPTQENKFKFLNALKTIQEDYLTIKSDVQTLKKGRQRTRDSLKAYILERKIARRERALAELKKSLDKMKNNPERKD